VSVARIVVAHDDHGRWVAANRLPLSLSWLCFRPTRSRERNRSVHQRSRSTSREQDHPGSRRRPNRRRPRNHQRPHQPTTEKRVSWATTTPAHIRHYVRRPARPWQCLYLRP